jgi:TolB-like protein/DNA-binding winged helix-turn-helix (wHTH) protein/Tfp pilus assembly protein PilF
MIPANPSAMIDFWSGGSVSESSLSPALVMRFGVFELDSRGRELRKRGRRIRLQDKPFEVLSALLDRPGELVTRESLREKLWPDNTFVDFDHGLNNAVNRLREALCDSADNPSFIETVPRRGYRFVGSVRIEGSPSSTSIAAAQRAPSTASTAIASVKHFGASDESAEFIGRRVSRFISRHKRLAIPVTAVALAAVTIIIVAISPIGLLAGMHWGRLRDLIVRGPAPVRIQSLAVLPLENLSGDAEQEYFADGMTAELITELAKIGSVRVISRTSAMRYKRTRKPLEQIAHELNVDALVEGEVLRSQNRVRVTAQLIQTATDRHLWSETYERDLRDAVELQGEVAESIATAIRTKVTSAEHTRLAGSRRVNPKAYEAYLKGRFLWNKRTESGLKKSIEYFQLAIDKDPRYALAYAALADSYQLSGVHERSPIKDAYPKAKAAADRALELDDSLGEAHTVLAGVMYGRNRDWRGAETEFKRAMELSPGYATAHSRYALFLMRMGRTGESLAEMRRAQALDPLSPAVHSSLGWLLLSARRYDEAIEQLQNSLEMDPDFGLTHLYLGWAYEAKENPEKAIDELQKAALSNSGTGELASLGHAYAIGGHARQAQSILKDLEERSRRDYVPPYDIAVVYAGLDNKDRAFEWLAKSCQDRDVELALLKADLELDNLRPDPRFKNLLHCVGLGQ